MRLLHYMGMLLIGFMSVSFVHASDKNAIIGKWKVINEKTGKATGIVQIKLDERTGLYYGLPIKSFRKGRTIDMKCTQCPGRFKNKPFKKIPAIWNFKYDKKKKKFTDGFVLDMISGKVYQGEIKVTKNAKSLRLRGSPLGAKFIGRTNIWIREK